MKSAKGTYLLQSGRIIGRCSSGTGRFGRRAGPRIQMAGMSSATPPWSSSSSWSSSSCCGGSSSSSGEGDLMRGPLVLLLLLPLLLVVHDVPASSAGAGTDELALPLLLLILPPVVWKDSPVPVTLRKHSLQRLHHTSATPPPSLIYHMKLKGANQSEQ